MADVTYPCYWQKKDQSGGWYWIYYAKTLTIAGGMFSSNAIFKRPYVNVAQI